MPFLEKLVLLHPFFESGKLRAEAEISPFTFHLSPYLVPWCNGSTSDFGSACPGSNPGGTTFLFSLPLGLGTAKVESNTSLLEYCRNAAVLTKSDLLDFCPSGQGESRPAHAPQIRKNSYNSPFIFLILHSSFFIIISPPTPIDFIEIFDRF